jgi:hypothetical protein
MKWRQWTSDEPHPWVQQLREDGEETDVARTHFEERLFSPVTSPWPLVAITTSVLVRSAKGRELAALNGVTLSDCPKIAPMVRLHVAVKESMESFWLENGYVGIPSALIPEVVAMLEAAAKFKVKDAVRSTS